LNIRADFVLDDRRQEVALDGRDAARWLRGYEINTYYTAVWCCTIDGDLVPSDVVGFAH
jgi:hypothetical protein